jgi:hypothetical protein
MSVEIKRASASEKESPVSGRFYYWRHNHPFGWQALGPFDMHMPEEFMNYKNNKQAKLGRYWCLTFNMRRLRK